MSDIIQRGLVGDSGNITLRRRASAKLLLTFVDDNNQPRDVSSRSYMFEVGNLRVPLTNGELPSVKVLTLTRTQVESLFGQVHNFIFLDETLGQDYSEDIWSNTLVVAS